MYLFVTKNIFPLNNTFLLHRVTVASRIYVSCPSVSPRSTLLFSFRLLPLFTPSAGCFPPGPSLPDITPGIASGCALHLWLTWASCARDPFSSKAQQSGEGLGDEGKVCHLLSQ